MAKAVSENVHGLDNEGLNFEQGLTFPLRPDVEEITHSFWFIILLQILRIIAINSISYNKTESYLFFIDVRCIFPNIDEDEY